jgi:hypothetical protein
MGIEIQRKGYLAFTTVLKIDLSAKDTCVFVQAVYPFCVRVVGEEFCRRDKNTPWAVLTSINEN